MKVSSSYSYSSVLSSPWVLNVNNDIFGWRISTLILKVRPSYYDALILAL